MRARTSGMTLVEIIVAVAVFSVVMIAVFLMSWSTSAKYSNSESNSLLHTFASQAMDFITEELSESGYVPKQAPPYPAGQAPTFPYVIVNAAPSGAEFGGYFNTAPYAHTACANDSKLASAITSQTFFGSTTYSVGTQEIVYIKPVYVSPGTSIKTYNPTSRSGYIDATSLASVWDIQQAPGTDVSTQAPNYYPTEEYSFLLEKGSDGVNELVNRKRFGTFPDGTQRHVLARHVERVVFEDYESTGTGIFVQGGTHYKYDPTMWVPAKNQVKVTLWLAKLDTAGLGANNQPTAVKVCVQSVVTLRNH